MCRKIYITADKNSETINSRIEGPLTNTDQGKAAMLVSNLSTRWQEN